MYTLILKAEEHFVLILKVLAHCTLLVSKIVCGHEKYKGLVFPENY